MKLTLIHPCIGRHAGDRRYIRSWQMEPLPAAVLAALTPPDVEVRFYDDRLETIPYDELTDLVAVSVETYTAQRAYQIASEYRRRGVRVVMGGFHAMLCPDEVARHAEAVVVGECEQLWPRVVDDARHGRLEPVYRQEGRADLAGVIPDRSIFRGKRYLKLRLVETGRGCRFCCEFCAIQTVFHSTFVRRPLDDIAREIRALKGNRRRPFFFFVDDNVTADLEETRAFLRAIAPLGIRWVSQASIDAARDEELCALMARSGCVGLLVGFESLDERNLKQMNKRVNAKGGYAEALRNLARHRIRIYSTFVFGYDHDTPASFAAAVDFAQEHAFYIAAFNHLTPFPGTPLYERLEREGRLLYDRWWLDPAYTYNKLPFRPVQMEPEEVRRCCIDARLRFYALPSIARRFWSPVNRSDFFMLRNFWLINLLIRREVLQRDELPLGDAGWRGELLTV